jgi:hypothetical protein
MERLLNVSYGFERSTKTDGMMMKRSTALFLDRRRLMERLAKRQKLIQKKLESLKDRISIMKSKFPIEDL